MLKTQIFPPVLQHVQSFNISKSISKVCLSKFAGEVVNFIYSIIRAVLFIYLLMYLFMESGQTTIQGLLWWSLVGKGLWL